MGGGNIQPRDIKYMKKNKNMKGPGGSQYVARAGRPSYHEKNGYLLLSSPPASHTTPGRSESDLPVSSARASSKLPLSAAAGVPYS